MRLYSDHHFPSATGRATFHLPSTRGAAEPVDTEYPLVLLTGRVKDQWHTRTRTGKVAKLNKSEPAPFLELHPEDAKALRVRNGQRVRVVSRRGAAEIPVRLTSNVRVGTLFAPFHWGALWDADGVANAVTTEAFDPRSKQPELKYAAVRIEAVN